MQLLTLARSTTLQWTLLVAALFTGFVVALLAFVYLKTKHDLTIRSDRMIASQMSVFAHFSPERRLEAIDEHLKQDPWRVRLAALFDPNGRRISGNLENLPPDLKTDNAAQSAVVDRTDKSGSERQAVRLIARRLPNGDVLAIGRNIDEVAESATFVCGAFRVWVVPARRLFLCGGLGSE